MSPILNQQVVNVTREMDENTEVPEEVIVRDSIIENKERTKCYWEQLMMAAAAENQTNAKIRVWDSPANSISNSNSNKNSKNSNNTVINSNHCNQYNGSKDYNENNNADITKTYVKADLTLSLMPMEDRIALELQEQKEREEELKRLRKQLSIESSKELSPIKDLNNGNEELCSIHTNDDSNFSEYGSEEKEHSLEENNSRVNTPYSESFAHRRTQSLDSVSSGLSSASGSILMDKDFPKRKVVVRPFEDPQEDEEIPAYMRNENETPIEKEIRIAKEREEELRKEKGIYVNSNIKAEQPKIQKVLSKKDAVENDTRDVQHRLATNRIQYEIEEANERENELRIEGKILTTSEETVDSKVTRFTQLAEYAILENRHKDSKMKRSLSVSHLAQSNPENRRTNSFETTKTMEPNYHRRFNPNPAPKGLMQRFIATKGKLSLPIINTSVESNKSSKSDKPQFTATSTFTSQSITKPSRKGYIPAGTKIQEELKEMEKREEELRMQRSYGLINSSHRHRSQPNLLNLSNEGDEYHLDPDNEEDEHLSWTSHKENPRIAPRLTHSLSNPNLLDDELDKVNIRLPNKRFSLLQQWENRIQSAQ